MTEAFEASQILIFRISVGTMEKAYNYDGNVVRGTKMNGKLGQTGSCFFRGPLLFEQQIVGYTDGLK